MTEKMRKVFDQRGGGYVLAYNVAVDNSFRMEFFETKELAMQKAGELKNVEYIGLSAIWKVQDYHEWIF